jgi:outer membrane protein assembly factor BamE (lipoprotein component of BamABCDE complex)
MYQCSHKYRNFVQMITSGLNKTNVRQYLGSPYKDMFEAQLEVMEVSRVD